MSQLTSQLAALSEVADEIESASEAIAEEIQLLRDAGCIPVEDLEYALDVLTKQTMALRFMVAEVRHQQDTDDTVRTFIRNNNTERRTNSGDTFYFAPDNGSAGDVGSDFD
jgi:hypothetical protein